MMPENINLSKSFIQQVERACKHFAKEDYLGSLAIAVPALRAALVRNPAHPVDLRGRGKALQQAIVASLESLKPSRNNLDPYVDEVYLCLYAHIHKCDYYHPDEKLKNVAAYFDDPHNPHRIPRPTYFNRRNKGLTELSHKLSQYLLRYAVLSESIIPTTPNFVGRNAELACVRESLISHRLAVIQGLGGMGKTALGAQAASMLVQEERPVCWITLRKGINDDVKTILYTWAAFLAHQGATQLWNFLNAEYELDLQIKPHELLLRQALDQVQPVLCLDNVEVFTPEQRDFWDILDLVRTMPSVSLLLISTQPPHLANIVGYDLLMGLTLDEVALLISQWDSCLDDVQLTTLMQYTGGNPRLLELSHAYVQTHSVQSKIDFTQALTHLTTLPMVEHYLLTEMFNALAAGEREAAYMLALARRPLDGVTLQEPPENWPLETMNITAEDFEALAERGLIHITGGNQWRLLPLLKTYLLQHPLESSPQAAFHDMLAQLHALQMPNVETAYHWAQSGQMEHAVNYLVQNWDTLLHHGQAAAMLHVLQLGEPDQPAMRHIWRDLQAQLLKLRGHYAQAFSMAQAMEQEASTPLAQAHARRVRGGIAEAKGQKDDAIIHYEHALALLDAQQMTEELWLHRDLAWALGQNDMWQQADQEALRAEMALENTRGIIARRRGYLEQALSHFARAIHLAQMCEDNRQLMRARNNRAAVYRELQCYPEAIQDYERNMHLVEHIGEIVVQAVTLLNMGIAHTCNGAAAQAISVQKQALNIFERLENTYGCYLANTNLAEAYWHQQDLPNAKKHAETDIAITTVPASNQAERWRIYTDILLAEPDCDKAWPAFLRAQELLYPSGSDQPINAAKEEYFQKTAERIRKLCKVPAKTS